MATYKENVKYSLDSIKSNFKINTTDKKQKKIKERVIPYESIDFGLYKKNANCSCFVTDENRIHFWILALADLIYRDLGSKPEYRVDWDTESESSETEFIVYDQSSQDELLYKVVVYVSTGKIMIQGIDYQNGVKNRSLRSYKE